MKEQPIFAEAFFKITSETISQRLFFYYYDISKIFINLKKTIALKGELELIKMNLQNFMDEDDLFVNKKKIRMIIRQISLEFQNNNPLYPYIIFNISSEFFSLFKSVTNLIHLYAKPERLPYSAISCWETIGTFNSVTTNSFNIISHDRKRLIFYMAKGEIIGGHERILINI